MLDPEAIAELRHESRLRGLREVEAAAEPFAQFAAWFAEIQAVSRLEPTAMTLATATPEGRPSARMVLLKGWDAGSFVFYTNYDSRKGGELAANPWAALVFYWPELERQVRVEGSVAPLPPEESDAYFASRPLGSRLGAWASAQSRVLPDRAVLEARMAALEADYPEGRPVPRPPYWGGFRVTPTRIEFWQGRLNRLHDRLCYTRQPDGGWLRERLSP
jgi:pyridoxamine 5'-phosphate oxidase